MERKAGEQRGRDERKRKKERQQGGDGRDNVGGNWREKMTVMRGIVYPSSRAVVSGIESCALILIMHTVDCWDDIGGQN
jgi:hypothetical protein